MFGQILTTALECLVDLGVTVAYAALAGLAIAGICVSDSGMAALWSALCWAALLPTGVLALIALDATQRVWAERRARRRRSQRQAADVSVAQSA